MSQIDLKIEIKTDRKYQYFAELKAEPHSAAELLRAVAAYWHGEIGRITIDNQKPKVFELVLGGRENPFDDFVDSIGS